MGQIYTFFISVSVFPSSFPSLFCLRSLVIPHPAISSSYHHLANLLIWPITYPGVDSAQAFWSLLLPHGLKGGALSHTSADDSSSDRDDDNDVTMEDPTEEGWKDEYTEWWFEFLAEKGGKGVSKDTWNMVCGVLPRSFFELGYGFETEIEANVCVFSCYSSSILCARLTRSLRSTI